MAGSNIMHCHDCCLLCEDLPLAWLLQRHPTVDRAVGWLSQEGGSVCHVVIRISAWLLVSALATSVALAAGSPCASGDQAELRRVALAAGARVELDLPQPAFTHLLEERGIDLALSVDGGANEELSVRPPRMGIKAIPGSARRIELRARDGQGAGEAWLWLHCLDASQARHIERLETLYRDQLEHGSAAASLALPGLAASVAASENDWSRAWWKHTRAQALQIAGNYLEASTAFDEAHAAWLGIRDRARAGVALMAAGEAASRAGDLFARRRHGRWRDSLAR